MTANKEKKYINENIEEMKPGYYWWLAPFLSENPEEEVNWSVTSWHPKNPRRVKHGVFVGPLPPPTHIKV